MLQDITQEHAQSIAEALDNILGSAIPQSDIEPNDPVGAHIPPDPNLQNTKSTNDSTLSAANKDPLVSQKSHKRTYMSTIKMTIDSGTKLLISLKLLQGDYR